MPANDDPIQFDPIFTEKFFAAPVEDNEEKLIPISFPQPLAEQCKKENLSTFLKSEQGDQFLKGVHGLIKDIKETVNAQKEISAADKKAWCDNLDKFQTKYFHVNADEKMTPGLYDLYGEGVTHLNSFSQRIKNDRISLSLRQEVMRELLNPHGKDLNKLDKCPPGVAGHIKDADEQLATNASPALARVKWEIATQVAKQEYYQLYEKHHGNETHYINYFAYCNAGRLGLKVNFEYYFTDLLPDKVAAVAAASTPALSSAFTVEIVISRLLTAFNLEEIVKGFEDKIAELKLNPSPDTAFLLSRYYLQKIEDLSKRLTKYGVDEEWVAASFFAIEMTDDGLMTKVSLQPDASKSLEITLMNRLFSNGYLDPKRRIEISLDLDQKKDVSPQSDQKEDVSPQPDQKEETSAQRIQRLQRKHFQQLLEEKTADILYVPLGKNNVDLGYVKRIGKKPYKYSTFSAYYQGLDDAQKKRVVEILIRKVKQFSSDPEKHSPIIELLSKSEYGYLEYLKAKINLVVPGRELPRLIFAAQKGYLDVIRYLVKEHKDIINQFSEDGKTPLYIASGKGRLDVVKVLVEEAGANLNQAALDGATPLFMAAQNGHLDVVKALIKAGANLNQAALDDGATPLLIAAQRGHLDVVKALIKAGANLNQAALDGATPLFIAILNKHLEVAKYLIEQGAQLTALIKEELSKWDAKDLFICAERNSDFYLKCLQQQIIKPDAKNQEGFTPMVFAARKGHLNIVKYLAQYYPQTLEDDQLLHFAAQGGHVEVMQYLIDQKGALVDQLNKTNQTPLWLAINNKHLKAIKCLISEYGAVLDEKTNNLLMSSAEGDANFYLQCLEEKIIGPLKKNKDGCTPIMFAASKGYLNVVEYLVTNYPKTYTEDCYGVNGSKAIHFAAEGGHLGVLDYLIKQRGTNLNELNRNNQTPLWYAIRKHLDAVKYLIKQEAILLPEDSNSKEQLMTWAAQDADFCLLCLEKGIIKPSEKNKDGWTPMMFAASKGYLNVVEYLVTNYPKTYTEDCYGVNGSKAIHFAAEGGHLGVLDYLIKQCGTNLNEPNRNNQTPLWFAINGKHLDLDAVKYLIEHKAILLPEDSNSKEQLMTWAAQDADFCLLCLNKEIIKPSEKSKDGWTLMMFAASKGYLNVVNYLATTYLKTYTEDCNKNGATPLYIASQNGYCDVVKVLVEAKADLNQAMLNGATPLLIAAERGHLNVVKALIEAKADLNQATLDNGATPLLRAILNKHFEVAKYLIEKGAELTDSVKEAVIKCNDKNLLMVAAKKNSSFFLKCLQDKHIDLTATNQDGLTPLMLAANQGYLDDVIRYLVIDQKILAKESGDGQILSYITKNQTVPQCKEIVRFLIKNDAAVNKQVDAWLRDFADDDLLMAWAGKEYKCFLDYIQSGLITPSTKNKDGLTPILLAAEKGYLEIIRVLISQGASVNESNEAGLTPLLIAVRKKNFTVVKFLIEQGAKLTALIKEELSKWDAKDLFNCAERNSHFYVECLKNGIIKPSARNKDGLTPMVFAAWNGHLNIVKYLAQHYPQTLEEDSLNNDFKPLHFAAKGGHVKVMRYLIAQKGALVNQFSKTHQTPLWFAINNKHLNAIECLIEYGAKLDEKANNLLMQLAEQDADFYLQCLQKKIITIEKVGKLSQSIQDKLIQCGNKDLLRAVAEKDSSFFLRCLQEKHIDLSAPNQDGLTPMLLAAKQGYLAVIKYLVSQKISVSDAIDAQITPLLLAITHKHSAATHYLIEQGAELNDAVKMVLFSQESRELWTEVCQKFKAKLPDFVQTSADFKNMLHYLPKEQRIEVYKQVRAKLPNIIQTSVDFKNVLCYLSDADCREVCQTFKEKLCECTLSDTNQLLQLGVVFEDLTCDQRKVVWECIKDRLPEGSIITAAAFQKKLQSCSPFERPPYFSLYPKYRQAAYLGYEARQSLYLEYQYYLTSMIETAGDLGRVLSVLSVEESEALCKSLSPSKLSEIIPDCRAFKKMLYHLYDGDQCKVVCESLKEVLLNRIGENVENLKGLISAFGVPEKRQAVFESIQSKLYLITESKENSSENFCEVLSHLTVKQSETVCESLKESLPGLVRRKTLISSGVQENVKNVVLNKLQGEHQQLVILLEKYIQERSAKGRKYHFYGFYTNEDKINAARVLQDAITYRESSINEQHIKALLQGRLGGMIENYLKSSKSDIKIKDFLRSLQEKPDGNLAVSAVRYGS